MKDTRKHEHEDARMVELLERLGAAERSVPDAGFEARIAAGSLAQAEAPIAFPVATKRAWWASTPVRIAAAVALVAGAWLVWNGNSTPGTIGPGFRGTGGIGPGSKVAGSNGPGYRATGSSHDAASDEEWFETYTLVTAALDGGAGDAIDELVSDTAELGTRVKGAGSLDSLLGDTL